MSQFKDMLGNTVRAGDMVRVTFSTKEATARVAEVSGGLAGPDGKVMPIKVQLVVPVPMVLNPDQPIAPVFKLADPANEEIARQLIERAKSA